MLWTLQRRSSRQVATMGPPEPLLAFSEQETSQMFSEVRLPLLDESFRGHYVFVGGHTVARRLPHLELKGEDNYQEKFDDYCNGENPQG
jgi:hypothetical protein